VPAVSREAVDWGYACFRVEVDVEMMGGDGGGVFGLSGENKRR
jgi:hypothetical protein